MGGLDPPMQYCHRVVSMGAKPQYRRSGRGSKDSLYTLLIAATLQQVSKDDAVDRV